jgi:hypothetical protein
MCLSIHPSISLSINVSIYLFMCLFYPSVYLLVILEVSTHTFVVSVTVEIFRLRPLPLGMRRFPIVKVILLCEDSLSPRSLSSPGIPEHVVGAQPLCGLHAHNSDPLSERPITNDANITRGNISRNYVVTRTKQVLRITDTSCYGRFYL